MNTYEILFKPYCLSYATGYEEKNKFAFDNKDDAFKILQSVYDTNYGSIHIDENLISIHTGGWSDNEEIISEFKKTFWWQSYFKIQATGGHYYFNTDHMADTEWEIKKNVNH